MPEDIDVASLLAANNIIALVALVLAFAATRLAKPDTSLPINIPVRWQPIFALVMGQVIAVGATAVYNLAATTDVTWKQAIVAGFRAGVGSILVYILGVKVARKGKDIAMPKPLSKYPPPPPPGSGSSMPQIPVSSSIPVIVDPDIPTKPEVEEKSGKFARYPRVAIVFVALAFMGCHPNAATLENAKTAGTYEAQLLACVETSKTRAESQACRCEVNKRWQRVCIDDLPEAP